ncbi:MAG: hypothetical protein ACNS62_03405 [Candidatus Cyclobacteriaceae bacterium M3_2C_046]
METNIYHQDRLIINYLYMKVTNQIDDIEYQELHDFLNEKGWHLYEMNKMIKDIRSWRLKNKEAVLA